jgi:hypothetical protein
MKTKGSIFISGIGELIASGGGLLMFGGVCILGYQCFMWLKEGVWRPHEVRMLWNSAPLDIDWAGVRQIAEWFAQIPLTATLFFIGFVVFVGGKALEAHFEYGFDYSKRHE